VASTPQTTALPPRAPGLPVLGNALDMRQDIVRYLLRLYAEHGSVFRINLLGREIWVMAGLEANYFLARSEDHLSSHDLFYDFSLETTGSHRIMTAIDGPAHKLQRKIQRPAYSREMMNNHLDTVIDITRAAVNTWPVGEAQPLYRTIQRVVTDQIGVMVVGIPTGDMFDDVLLFFRTALAALVTKTTPRLTLWNPAYQRARRRVLDFAYLVLRQHKDGTTTQRAPIVDAYLNTPDENGQPYDDETIVGAITGGYFAGLDTVAATLSFMVAAILKTPGLAERITAEADAAFVNGTITPRMLEQLPTIHHAAIETLRLYSVAPFTPRTVVKPFEFGGYHFPEGTYVYFAQTLTHRLPEFFPNPETFDVDRYDRPDYVKPGQAFAPFTLGAHTCLGAGMAETQLMVTAAALFHFAELTLVPADAPLQIHTMPLPNPGDKLSFAVTRRRH